MKKEFFIYGAVHPDEWDWKKEFATIVKDQKKNPLCYMTFDLGKIMGIVSHLATLEEENKELKEKINGKEN